MKIKTIIAAAFTAVFTTTGAHAVPLDLVAMLNFNQDGMVSSLIHDQNGDPNNMSGATVATFGAPLTGSFDVGGAGNNIAFKGVYSGGTYEAEGRLELSGSRMNGLFGDILFKFTGGLFDGQGISFNFLDKTFNPDANKFGSGNAGTAYEGLNFVGLWGSSCSGRDDDQVLLRAVPKCYGIDLRIQHDGDPDGGSIPLPASAFLLLAGIGGLGVSRKLRK